MARSEGQAGADVVTRQLWEILEDLLDAHSTRQILENVADSYTHATDTRLAATFSGFNCDQVLNVHTGRLKQGWGPVNDKPDFTTPTALATPPSFPSPPPK